MISFVLKKKSQTEKWYNEILNMWLMNWPLFYDTLYKLRNTKWLSRVSQFNEKVRKNWTSNDADRRLTAQFNILPNRISWNRRHIFEMNHKNCSKIEIWVVLTSTLIYGEAKRWRCLELGSSYTQQFGQISKVNES